MDIDFSGFCAVITTTQGILILVVWIFLTIATNFLFARFKPEWKKKNRLLLSSAAAPFAVVFPLFATAAWDIFSVPSNSDGAIDFVISIIPNLVGSIVLLIFGVFATMIFVTTTYALSLAIDRILKQ